MPDTTPQYREMTHDEMRSPFLAAAAGSHIEQHAFFKGFKYAAVGEPGKPAVVGEGDLAGDDEQGAEHRPA